MCLTRFHSAVHSARGNDAGVESPQRRGVPATWPAQDTWYDTQSKPGSSQREPARLGEWGMGSPMRKQYQQRQGCGVDAYRRRRTARRMATRLGARLPLRIIVPFLLFWSLGSVVLGHELASLPLASFASAVMRPLQATLQVQGAFPHAQTHAAPVAPAQVVTGGLGNKAPVIAHRRAGAKSGRTKHGATARAASLGLSAGQSDVTLRGAPDDWQPGAYSYGYMYDYAYSDYAYSAANSASMWAGLSPRGGFADSNAFRWSEDWQSARDWVLWPSDVWP